MSARPDSYRQVHVPPAERKNGVKVDYAHVRIAERALGRRLPAGAMVHHVDENKQNNAKSNLVICQDAAYHRLLHYRMKVRRAGGNPNTDKFCSDCCQVKPMAAFNVMRSNKSNGRQSVCRECGNARDRVRHARDRAAAA